MGLSKCLRAVFVTSFIVFLSAPAPVRSQSITTVHAKFDAWIPGDKETMVGNIKINVLAFGGTVTGRTSRGVKCRGTVSVNVIFSAGSGAMTCSDGRKGKFTYTLTSSLPPRGTGVGKMSNGKTVKFRIRPAKP